jgi:hypothetical protein
MMGVVVGWWVVGGWLVGNGTKTYSKPDTPYTKIHQIQVADAR